MSLIKWEPFDEIDSLFRDFGILTHARNNHIGFDLGVDVSEKGNNIIAEMNLPGVEPKNIDVLVEDAHLRISGRREESKEDKNKHYYSKEIRRGSFERVVPLPQAVRKNEVVAEFKNGTLKVTLPKLELESSEKVKIQVME